MYDMWGAAEDAENEEKARNYEAAREKELYDRRMAEEQEEEERKREETEAEQRMRKAKKSEGKSAEQVAATTGPSAAATAIPTKAAPPAKPKRAQPEPTAEPQHQTQASSSEGLVLAHANHIPSPPDFSPTGDLSSPYQSGGEDEDPKEEIEPATEEPGPTRTPPQGAPLLARNQKRRCSTAAKKGSQAG